MHLMFRSMIFWVFSLSLAICLAGCATGANKAYDEISQQDVKVRVIEEDSSANPAFLIPFDPRIGEIRISTVPVRVGVSGVSEKVGLAINSQLMYALHTVENFVLLDREISDAIARELELSRSSLVAPPDKIGNVNLEVADLILVCTVVDFAEAEGTRDQVEFELGTLGHMITLVPGGSLVGNALIMANPNFGRSEELTVSKVTIEMRLVDVRSSTVVSVANSTTSFAMKKVTTQRGGFGFSDLRGSYARTTFAQASRVAIERCVTNLHRDIQAKLTA